MTLEHYRNCTWREKRQVLNVFWRSDSTFPEQLVIAAQEYGYYAVICLAVIVVEVAVLTVAAFDHGSVFSWWLCVAGALVAFVTVWALVRYRVLRTVISAHPS